MEWWWGREWKDYEGTLRERMKALMKSGGRQSLQIEPYINMARDAKMSSADWGSPAQPVSTGQVTSSRS